MEKDQLTSQMEELREEYRKTKEVRRVYRHFLLAVTSVRRHQIHVCRNYSPLQTIPQPVIKILFSFLCPAPPPLLPVTFLLCACMCVCAGVVL